ncbi:MAG TPA: hypothetical protein VFM08_04755 [Nocardioides sp.]|jgi:hypothetical protein|nr:hypothetical protein [Nocardioides sp.]
MTSATMESRPTWSAAIGGGVRRLSAATVAGALLGLLVGGVGGRLAMMLLARLNPEVHGLDSDDGFQIGQVSGATFNLLFVATLIGIFGSVIYLTLRGLMVGPRWFQVLSISLGPAVVVGNSIVHSDGIDFTLDPALLAIAMFVLIPGIYAALLTVLAERWLADDRWFARAPGWLVALPLLLWIPMAPLLVPFALGFVALEALRRTRSGAVVLARPVWPHAIRGLLGVLFTLSLVGLIQDTSAIV